jgi:hypothetical protein
MNFHRTDVNPNISASVTVGLGCLACELLHSYKDSITARVTLAVILSDQSFPPILPANDDKCVVVVRVEDGLLSEIEQAFLDHFAKYVGPIGSLPRGRVILMGSVSHLGSRGLASYASDMCGVMASLGNRVGQAVEVVPFVPVPI